MSGYTYGGGWEQQQQTWAASMPSSAQNSVSASWAQPSYQAPGTSSQLPAAYTPTTAPQYTVITESVPVAQLNPEVPHKPGNNRFGSAGTLKCEKCRMRRKKCDYEKSRPDLPCKWCAQNGHAKFCVKVPAPAHSRPSSQEPAALSTIAAMLEREDPHANVVTIFERVKVIIEDLQRPVKFEDEDDDDSKSAAAYQTYSGGHSSANPVDLTGVMSPWAQQNSANVYMNEYSSTTGQEGTGWYPPPGHANQYPSAPDSCLDPRVFA